MCSGQTGSAVGLTGSLRPVSTPSPPQAALNSRLQQMLADRCAQPDLEGLEQKPKGVRKNKVEDIKTEMM